MPRKKKNNKNKSNNLTREQIMARYNTTSSTKTSVTQKSVSDEKISGEVSNYKSPICSFFGHVDAGKTSLMDAIKSSTIANFEAGGITQSIKSYFIDINSIKKHTIKFNNSKANEKYHVDYKVPGLIVLDTPGHQAFSEIRKRGTKLCNIAIVVIDINDGVKEQTNESIKLLVENKIPFIIVVNKIDTINGWNKTNFLAFKRALKEQTQEVENSIIYEKIGDIKYDLQKAGINSEYYIDNKKPSSVYSIVPVSSKTKEGLADVLSILIYLSQNWMEKKLIYREKLKAIVMESKQDKKLGWVLDAMIVNGTIKVGDKLIVNSYSGPKQITVRNLIKNQEKEYCNNIRASGSAKILASNMEKCYTGTNLYLVDNNEKELIQKADEEITNIWSNFSFDDKGLVLIAPTLGELEALYFLTKKEKIPVKNVIISVLTDKTVSRAYSYLENVTDKYNRSILYFGNLNKKEVDSMSNKLKEFKIELIHSKIVYQLIENFKKYKEDVMKNMKDVLVKEGKIYYPCRLKVLEDHIYMRGGDDDLLFGIRVLKGKLSKNAILIADNGKQIGKITSIQKDKKELDFAKINDEVCIRVEKVNPNDENIVYNRHFNSKNILQSKVDKEMLSLFIKLFKEELNKDKKYLLFIKEIIESLNSK